MAASSPPSPVNISRLLAPFILGPPPADVINYRPSKSPISHLPLILYLILALRAFGYGQCKGNGSALIDSFPPPFHPPCLCERDVKGGRTSSESHSLC